MTDKLGAVINRLGQRVRALENLRHAPVDTARQTVFTLAGVLTTGVGAIAIENRLRTTQTITGVYLRCSVAPLVQAIVVDVNLYDAAGAGGTIFAAPSRPQIAAGALYGSSVTLATTAWPVGYYLTIDRDQVGTGTPGSNLVVVIAHRGA